MSTTSPDVQNVPDVWTLLEEAQQWFRLDLNMPTPEYAEFQAFGKRYLEALAQRDRFVLVPNEATDKHDAEMWTAVSGAHWGRKEAMRSVYRAALAAAPKPMEKP